MQGRPYIRNARSHHLSASADETRQAQPKKSQGEEKKEAKQQSLDATRDQKKVEGPTLSSLHGAQTDMYLAQLVVQDNKAYTHTLAMTIKNDEQKFSVSTFSKALRYMLNRHDALRSYFVEINRQIKQVTLPMQNVQITDAWPLKAIDATDLPTRPKIKNLAATLEKLGHETLLEKSFVLRQGPLWRAVLVKYKKKRYQLLFIFHHIIFDGNAAQNKFISELSAVYRALREGKQESDISLPPIQRLCDIAPLDVSPQKKQYWQQTLADYTPVHFGKEQKCFGFKGNRLPLAIPAELVGRIQQQFLISGNASLHSVILSALYVLLYRYTGQTDLCVLTPAMTHRDVNAINCFVNTVPLRAQFPTQATFAEMLNYVRNTVTIPAYKNQVPIDLLSQIKTDSIMFVLNQAKTKLDIPGVFTSSPVELDLGVAKFENFAVSLDECEDGLRGVLELNQSLEEEAFKHFNEHLVNILMDATLHPQKKLFELDMLTEQEKRILALSHPKFKQRNFRGFGHDLLTQCADKFPRKTAAVFHYPGGDTESIAFKRLHDESKAVAAFLQGLKCNNDKERIGIAMSRSPNLLIATFGVMYAGACAVPLENAASPELFHKVKDAKVTDVLTDQTTENLFPGDDFFTVNLSSKHIIHAMVAESKLTFQPPQLATDSMMNIRYTSGSTGAPKGVLVRHGGMRNLIGELIMEDIRSDDKILAIAPHTFDAFDFDWGLAWSHGAEIHYVVENTVPSEIFRVITENNITVATLPANIVKLLDPEKLPSLRYVITMGSALDDATQKRWSSVLAQRGGKFINGYGPTENTIATSMRAYVSNDDRCNIGRPFPGNQCFVINPADGKNEMPPGKSGELYIMGKQVAEGYLDQPQQTQAKFPCMMFNPKQNRFVTADQKHGADIYATGDIVHLDRANNIIYERRKDSQVKIGDTRIELDGMKTILLKHTDLIADVAILVSEDQQNLFAYVVPKNPSHTLDIKTINSILREAGQPSAARVSQVMTLKEMPLTRNGKHDTKALKRLKLKTAPEQKSREADPIEKILLSVWREVLGLGSDYPINLTDNFFDIGGGSRKAGRLEMEINAAFNCAKRFSILTVLQNCTIQAIATVLKRDHLQNPAAQQSPDRFFTLPSPMQSASPARNPHGTPSSEWKLGS